MSNVAKKVLAYLEDLLRRCKQFTGQVFIEIHYKNGELKDMYIGDRGKVKDINETRNSKNKV